MLMGLVQAATGLSHRQQFLKLKAAALEEEAVQEALQAADYGKWRGFYTRGDWLVDVPLTLALIKAYQGKLEGREVPEDVLARVQDSRFAYTMIKAYQGGRRVEF